jgi:hypothetical protein
MHIAIGLFCAGVAVACGAAAVLLALRRARDLRPPRCEVMPVVPYCRVRDVAALVAALRISGMVVEERRRQLDVRTLGGRAAIVALPASRRLGREPFAIRSHHAPLVHELATIASRELGPLVCWIDGQVHGFDLDPDDEPDVARRFAAQQTDEQATRAMPVPRARPRARSAP